MVERIADLAENTKGDGTRYNCWAKGEIGEENRPLQIGIARHVDLREVGKADIPMMVISNGSTAQEQVALGTPQSIMSEVKSLGIGAPGIIVVGEVVALHPEYILEKVAAQWS